MTPLGYAYNINEPDVCLGRVTTFGASVAAACRLHSRCKVLRTAKKYDKLHMLRWLAMGKLLPSTATSKERGDEAKKHIADFAKVVVSPTT